MAPPLFKDLGKSSRDIFDKGYNYGFHKVQYKAKTDSDVHFTVNGDANTDTGKILGKFETKYKYSEYGLTFTEKWNTDNVLNTEISIDDQLFKGSKLAFETSFAPHTGKKSGKIKSGYKDENVNLSCDVDFDFAGPTIHGAGVLAYTGWLAGYQMSFDTSKSKLTKSNFAVGYKTGDFTLHTSIKDGHDFGGSVYQKVNENLETAINLAWTSGTNTTKFGLAAKYALDKNCSINAKVNNVSQVGLGITHKLRDGVKLTISSLIEGKNINAGGHKTGVGLEFEA